MNVLLGAEPRTEKHPLQSASAPLAYAAPPTTTRGGGGYLNSKREVSYLGRDRQFSDTHVFANTKMANLISNVDGPRPISLNINNQRLVRRMAENQGLRISGTLLRLFKDNLCLSV